MASQTGRDLTTNAQGVFDLIDDIGGGPKLATVSASADLLTLLAEQTFSTGNSNKLAIDADDATKITSAGAGAYTFLAADVGKRVKITGGTGFTVGTYTITAVAAGVATLSAACGTAGSTGGAGTMTKLPSNLKRLLLTPASAGVYWAAGTASASTAPLGAGPVELPVQQAAAETYQFYAGSPIAMGVMMFG